MTFILAFLFQLLSLMPLAAENSPQPASDTPDMTVIPRDVFIGDEMEIRYSFSSSLELLPSETDSLLLDVPDSDDVTVLGVMLTKEAARYVLTARCIGWRTGSVQLPEIVLVKGTDTAGENDVAAESGTVAGDGVAEPDEEAVKEPEPSFSVKIPPVIIQSVVEYTGKTDLQSARPPIVIPGTTWIIYAIIILCVILFVILIIILLRFNAFKSRFFAVFSSVLIARNYRLLRRRLKRFLKRYLKVDTEQFATELAHFIRGYMSVRFKTDFSSVTASEFVSVFADAMNFTGSPESFGATEVIADILLRCDYVRFSGDTGVSGTFTEEERSKLCSDFLTAVACYDREGRK